MSQSPAVAFAARNVAYSTDERVVERSFNINGIPISLSKTVYVSHDVILPSGTGVHFDAVRRRWYHLVLRLFALGRPLGIPTLDEGTAISSPAFDATRTFFEHPARASLVAQIIAGGGQVRWHDDHVIVEVPDSAFPDDGLAKVTLLLDTVLPAALLPDGEPPEVHDD